MPRTRRRGNPMVRIGVFLIIIGFGSTVLHEATDYQFTIIAWADGMQPYIGIIVGLIGIGLLATPFIMRSRQGGAGSPIAPGAAFATPAGSAPVGGQPVGFDQQPGFHQQPGFQQQNGFSQQGGFAPQGGMAPQGGFAQPTSWEQQPGFGQQQQFNQGGFAQQPQAGGQQQFGQGQPGWPQQ